MSLIRHTFAIRLDAQGVGIATIMQLMGHSSPDMHMRYSRPGAMERRRAVALLSNGHHMDTTCGKVVSSSAANLLNLKRAPVAQLD